MTIVYIILFRSRSITDIGPTYVLVFEHLYSADYGGYTVHVKSHDEFSTLGH